MWMMREPRGQLHRSMLGFLILSSSSWSSSQRSSFTSSATWVPNADIYRAKFICVLWFILIQSFSAFVTTIINIYHNLTDVNVIFFIFQTCHSEPLNLCCLLSLTWWEEAANRIHPSSREMTNSPLCSSMLTCPPPNSTSGYTDTMLQSLMKTRLVFTFSW